MPRRNEATVSIVIPTFRRRTALLARTLEYYTSVACPFPIVVADSGDADAQQANRAVVDAMTPAIVVSHRRYPVEQDIFGKLADALAHASTPYVVVCGDDDFLVPSAVQRCARHLDAHPDVAAVGGREVQLRSGAPGSEPRVAIHPQASIADDEAATRLQRHFSHYWPTFYCVQRADALARNMAAASEYGNSLFGELLQSGLTITAGKYDYLDVLYLARHVLHGELHMPLWHEMAGSEHYRANTDTLCRRLAEEIGPPGSREERELLVHDAFRRFVRPLQRRRPATLTKAVLAITVLPRAVRAAVFGGKLRDAARSPARFLRTCWVERQDARYGDWALHRLRDPRAPHHDAFAPIYECFQRWPAGIPPESVTASNRTGASGRERES